MDVEPPEVLGGSVEGTEEPNILPCRVLPSSLEPKCTSLGYCLSLFKCKGQRGLSSLMCYTAGGAHFEHFARL